MIGRVQYLYTMEHAVKNIAYHRFQSISVTVLSLIQANSLTVHLLDPAYLLKYIYLQSTIAVYHVY